MRGVRRRCRPRGKPWHGGLLALGLCLAVALVTSCGTSSSPVASAAPAASKQGADAGCPTGDARRARASRHESEGYLHRAWKALSAAQHACATEADEAKLLALQRQLGMTEDDRAPADAKTREEVLATLDLAWRARARGDGRAEGLFRGAIQRWPTQPSALVGLGLTLRAGGDEGAARRLFARALVFAERQTGEEPRAVLVGAFGSHKLAVVADDGSVALDSGRDLRLLAADGEERCRVSYSPFSRGLQFDARGERVGLVLSNGEAQVFDSYSCRTIWESSSAGSSSVTHLAFADDGRTLVLATADAIEIVNTSSEAPRVRIGLPADCAVAALSAGAAPRRVWVGCRQGHVVLARVDPHGAPLLSRLERPAGAKPPLLAVAPRESRVVVAYASGSPFVVLDESGRVHWRAPAERSRRIGVALSADGTTVIRNACPGVERWSFESKRWRKTRFATMVNRPGSPSISPDGSFVVASCGMVGVGVGGGRTGLCRWPLREGVGLGRQGFKRYELYPRLSGVRRLVRAADDSALLVLDQTGRLRHWSPARGLLWSAPAALRGLSTAHCGGSLGASKEQQAFTRFPGTIAISADGERWAYGGNGRQSATWHGATGAARVAADARGLAFVPRTDWVATSPPLRLWSRGSGELAAEAPADRLDDSKGALLVAASARAAVARLSEGKLSVWQVSPLRKVMEADLSSGPPRALALSPKAVFVAARSGMGATSIWQVASGSKICTLADKPRAQALAFADDTQLLSGTAEGLTRWRAANCAEEGLVARDKRRLPSHQEARAWNVGAAHFGQPRELLFTVGPKLATEALRDGTLRLTLTATGGRALLQAARDADGGVVLLRDGTADLLGSDHEAAARLLRCQVGHFNFPFVACEGRLRVEGALRSFYAGHHRTAW